MDRVRSLLERHDFVDEEDARANIVDWLERLADPRSGAPVEMAKANAVAAGAVATGVSTTLTAEIVGETVIDIAGELDWIEMVAEWLFS
ncbi:hypothetical protein [Burkholderia sp. AU31652]|uniref:hypothetical protein n=1 Tax=Burkholderia sp. AU31652 TaxID=2015354 RepID=UPI00211AEA6D|nr:hypothetical protein [Burkholderia sp. AU31652]